MFGAILPSKLKFCSRTMLNLKCQFLQGRFLKHFDKETMLIVCLDRGKKRRQMACFSSDYIERK